MGEQDRKIDNCIEMALDYLKGISLTKGLSIIIDICDEIRYSKIEKEDIDQKILKVIHDLIESDSKANWNLIAPRP